MKYLLLFIIFLFSGCLTTTTNFSSNSIPNWYLNAPNNSSSMLYGTGEGVTLKEAKANAIEDMASRVRVKVNSIYTKRVTTHNQNYDKVVQKEIHLSVEDFTFQNAKILKSSQSRGKTYILMGVDRRELFNRLYSDFKEIDNQIKSKISLSKTLSPYEEMKIIYKIEPLIKKASIKSSILKTINSNFDRESYLNYYDKIKNRADRLRENLTFSINRNQINRAYAEALTNLISKKGFKIKDNSPIKIDIIVERAKSQTAGFYIYRDRVTLTLKVDGKILSTQVVQTKGVSQNLQNAINRAVKDFSQKVDIDKLIF